MNEAFSKGSVIILLLLTSIISICFSLAAAVADVNFSRYLSVSGAWSTAVPQSEWLQAKSALDRAIEWAPLNAEYRYEFGKMMRLCSTYWVDCGLDKSEANRRSSSHFSHATDLRDSYGRAQISLALTQRDAGLPSSVYLQSLYEAEVSAPHDPQMLTLSTELLLSRWDELGVEDREEAWAVIAQALNSPKTNVQYLSYRLIQRFGSSIHDQIFFEKVAVLMATSSPGLESARTIFRFWSRWPAKNRAQILESLSDNLETNRDVRMVMQIASEENKVPLACAFLGRNTNVARICSDPNLFKRF